MKYAIFAALLLLAIYGANAATIEEQIKDCESSPYPDLCLATLSRSDDLALESEKSREELIADCRNSAYGDLCIAALAKSRNNKEVCSYIEDEYQKSSCIGNLEETPKEKAAEISEEVLKIISPEPSKARPNNNPILIKIIIAAGLLSLAVLAYFALRRAGFKHNDNVYINTKNSSYNSQVLDYIKLARKKGFSDSRIKDELISVGWPASLTDKLLRK